MFRHEIEAAGFKLRQVPQDVGAAIGNAVHKAAEVTLAEKARTGALPPESVASNCAAQTVQEEVAAGVQFDIKGITRNLNDAQAQSVKMARAYHRVIAPTIEPLMVEERLDAEIAPGVILSGKPDLVAREPKMLRDVKTSSRARPGSHAPQIGAYSLLIRSNGLDIDSASVDYVRRTAPDKPQPDPISAPVQIAPAETAAANIIRHIRHDLEIFRNGDRDHRILSGDAWAFAANPNSVLCSDRFCPAWGTDFCHEWIPKD